MGVTIEGAISELELPADIDGTELAIEAASLSSSRHEMDEAFDVAIGSGVEAFGVAIPSTSLADMGTTVSFSGEVGVLGFDGCLNRRKPHCWGWLTLPLLA